MPLSVLSRTSFARLSVQGIVFVKDGCVFSSFDRLRTNGFGAWRFVFCEGAAQQFFGCRYALVGLCARARAAWVAEYCVGVVFSVVAHDLAEGVD